MIKKYIAPIIITGVAVAYGIGMAVFLFIMAEFTPISAGLIVLIIGGPIALAALFVAALVQRIKEIKGGEEDVASKY